jgi:glycosyltransferase involved in cell wall biosynthesis
MEQQLDSILNQTVKVHEIIVCEDNSTDNTKAILKSYSDQNEGLFKIHHNATNLGSNKNAEKAIQLCTGDIVFLSDHDDFWLPNKVEDTLSYFKRLGINCIELMPVNEFEGNESDELGENLTNQVDDSIVGHNNKRVIEK